VARMSAAFTMGMQQSPPMRDAHGVSALNPGPEVALFLRRFRMQNSTRQALALHQWLGDLPARCGRIAEVEFTLA
jgi:hypothetical protein